MQLQQGGVLDPAVTNFLNSQSYNSSKPKAFLNWLLLDEQLKYAGGGFEQVGDNEVFSTHIRNSLPVSKNAYLYVYTSNESPVDLWPLVYVFFDKLQSLPQQNCSECLILEGRYWRKSSGARFAHT